MYNIPYLIYMNWKLGKLDLYQLDVVNKTFIKFKECINLIPEWMHKAHVIDNLLVVHNLDAQFSKLFDFSVKPITEAMWKNLPINSKFSADSFVWDGIQAHHEVDYVDEDDENIESLITGRKKFMFYDSPIISPLIDFSKPQGWAAGNVDDNDEDQAVNINIEFRYDNEYVEKIKVEEEKEVPKKDINVQNDSEYGVFSNVYSSDAVYVPDNIILDLEFGVSFGYMLSLKNYASMGKSPLRAFKSMLLRNNSKQYWLRYIKYLILRKTSLEIMTKIFLKIHEIYKEASQERQMKNNETNSAKAFDIMRTTSKTIGTPANQIMKSMNMAVSTSDRNILPSQVGSDKLNNVLNEQSEDTTRVLSGEIIIFQHEMVQIFNDLIDLNTLSYVYLKAIILEYIRCLQEFNLPSQPRLQTILWKFIWSNRDLIGLQNLLQYKVLDDNLELAQHLVQLGCNKDLEYDTKNPKNQVTTLSLHYSPAFDFGINMMFRLRQFRDVFCILLKIGKYSKALDFAKSSGVDFSAEYINFRETIESDAMLSERNKSILLKRLQIAFC